MRPLRAVVAVAVCACFALLSRADESALEGDLARLQGKWTASVGPFKTNPMTFEVKGSDLIIQVGSAQGFGRTYTLKGQVKLDENAKPHSMTWTKLTANDKDGEDVESIYELDGDTLKILSAGPGNPRPEAFAEKSDDAGDLTLVLKREKDQATTETSESKPASR